MNSELLAQVTNPLISSRMGTGWDFFNNTLPAFINIGFLIASVVFVFIFIVGSFQWITSGSDKEKLANARGRITHAIIGLLVLLLIFFITQLVNYILGLNIGRLGNPPGGPTPVVSTPAPFVSSPTPVTSGPTSINTPTSTSTPSLCTDSDGGYDIFIQGVIQEGSVSFRDSCTGGVLTEYYCGTVSNGSAIYSNIVNCTCVSDGSGACLGFAPPPTVPFGGATSTPIPSSTPVPTSTPRPTNTPMPTSTPIPTATPTRIPTATPTTPVFATAVPPTATPTSTISPLTFCTDTDGGVNIALSGTVSENTSVPGVTTNSSDICRSSSSLNEYSCGASLNLVTQSVSCGAALPGSICQRGECCVWAGSDCSSGAECCSPFACASDNTCRAISNIVLNSAMNTSCQILCNSIGYADAGSIGTDAAATNGATYVYSNGTCSQTLIYQTNSVVTDQGGPECAGNRANWTNCRCI